MCDDNTGNKLLKLYQRAHLLFRRILKQSWYGNVSHENLREASSLLIFFSKWGWVVVSVDISIHSMGVYLSLESICHVPSGAHRVQNIRNSIQNLDARDLQLEATVSSFTRQLFLHYLKVGIQSKEQPSERTQVFNCLAISGHWPLF